MIRINSLLTKTSPPMTVALFLIIVKISLQIICSHQMIINSSLKMIINSPTIMEYSPLIMIINSPTIMEYSPLKINSTKIMEYSPLIMIINFTKIMEYSPLKMEINSHNPKNCKLIIFCLRWLIIQSRIKIFS